MNFKIEREQLLKIKHSNYELYQAILSLKEDEVEGDYCETLDKKKLMSECVLGYFNIEDLFSKSQIIEAYDTLRKDMFKPVVVSADYETYAEMKYGVDLSHRESPQHKHQRLIFELKCLCSGSIPIQVPVLSTNISMLIEISKYLGCRSCDALNTCRRYAEEGFEPSLVFFTSPASGELLCYSATRRDKVARYYDFENATFNEAEEDEDECPF